MIFSYLSESWDIVIAWGGVVAAPLPFKDRRMIEHAGDARVRVWIF